MKLIKWKFVEEEIDLSEWWALSKRKRRKKTQQNIVGEKCAHYNVNMQWNHHSPFAI